MEKVASDNTQSTIKHRPVFTSRYKEAFRDYKPKLHACLSLYSKPIFEVLKGKTQPSYFLTAHCSC